MSVLNTRFLRVGQVYINPATHTTLPRHVASESFFSTTEGNMRRLLFVYNLSVILFVCPLLT